MFKVIRGFLYVNIRRYADIRFGGCFFEVRFPVTEMERNFDLFLVWFMLEVNKTFMLDWSLVRWTISRLKLNGKIYIYYIILR